MSTDEEKKNPARLKLVPDTGAIRRVREAVLDMILLLVDAGRDYVAAEEDLSADDYAGLVADAPGTSPETVRLMMELARDETICALAARRASWPNDWPLQAQALVKRALDSSSEDSFRIVFPEGSE